MPESPHEYIVRRKVDDDASFDALVRFIRANGEVRTWGRKAYLYWLHEGRYYWTMGWPVDETIIVNRALCGESKSVALADRQDESDIRWSSKDGFKPPV